MKILSDFIHCYKSLDSLELISPLLFLPPFNPFSTLLPECLKNTNLIMSFHCFKPHNGYPLLSGSRLYRTTELQPSSSLHFFLATEGRLTPGDGSWLV